jgi:hypothetical protein
LVQMAAAAAAHPAGRITQVFMEAAARESAFRWVRNEAISAAAVVRATSEATVRRCLTSPWVAVPVDGTSLLLSDEGDNKDFGLVGTRRAGARGLHVMTGIAVTPDGTPQGITGQVYWTRAVSGRARTCTQRRTMRAEDKETQRWLDVLEQTTDAYRARAWWMSLWFQLDRGADAWPVYRWAQEHGQRLTVRATWNRRLVRHAGQRQQYLREAVVRQPVLADYLLAIPASAHRTARLAMMQVRSCRVELDLKDQRTRQRHPTRMWAVHVREASRVPRGETPLEWLLLTTERAATPEQAWAVVWAYTQRWRVEDFHKTWKTGACRVEDTQLTRRRNVERWASMMAAVAMRIERLKHLSRTTPEVPATVELTQHEIDAAIVLTRQAEYRRGDVPSLGEVVLWIAQQGGYTGKSSGGPPGATVLRRGLERIEVLAEYFASQSATEN